jgi:hypothetical protein
LRTKAHQTCRWEKVSIALAVALGIDADPRRGGVEKVWLMLSIPSRGMASRAPWMRLLRARENIFGSGVRCES